jgi:hypothetical protein
MYLAEQGEPKDVPDLLRIKDLVPYYVGEESSVAEDVEPLIDDAVEQICQRMMNSTRDLREFYAMGHDEFEQLVGLARIRANPSAAPSVERKIKSLRAIRESLERQFPEAEIRRWLHAPNSKYRGQTPVQEMMRGGMGRMLDDLNRLEEGVPN